MIPVWFIALLIGGGPVGLIMLGVALFMRRRKPRLSAALAVLGLALCGFTVFAYLDLANTNFAL